MNNEIKLIGQTEIDGITFTGVEGGFGEGKKSMLAKDVAVMHDVETKYIQKLINKNVNRFTNNDLLDLCEENFKVHAKNLGLITSNGQKYCYLLSERGYTKLVSMMDNSNEKKWEVMDKLIDGYFSMREVINSSDKLKADLLLNIYNGGQAGILASKQLSELETAEAVAPLNKQIEEDSPFVSLAKERLDKGEKISLTDVTKSLGLKKGQISVYLKQNGYIHRSITEVNKKGEGMFKIYKENGFSCIGILEEGIKLINDNLEDIKQSPSRMPKTK